MTKKTPTFAELLLPILQSCRDGREVTRAVIEDRVAKAANLTADDIRNDTGRTKGKAGKRPVYPVRIGWGLNFLVKLGYLLKTSGAINSPDSCYQIADKALHVLDGNPSTGDLHMQLKRERRALKDTGNIRPSTGTDPARDDESEEETEALLIRIARKHTDDLAHELLESIRTDKSGDRLEDICRELLVKMGYGEPGDAEKTGGTGDGGIDGRIGLDKFGFDLVCYQAKVTEKTIGQRMVREFVGALEGAGSTKGLFITTAPDFSPDAKKYVEQNLTRKIILITGSELARLMIRHNVGVEYMPDDDAEARAKTAPGIEYGIKQIDHDYFM